MGHTETFPFVIYKLLNKYASRITHTPSSSFSQNSELRSFEPHGIYCNSVH